jgi:hypothetical protein
MRRLLALAGLWVGAPVLAQDGVILWNDVRLGMTGAALQAAHPELPEYKLGRRLYRMESLTEYRDTVIGDCVGRFRVEHYPRVVSLEIDMESCPTRLEGKLTERHGRPVKVEETERYRRVSWDSQSVHIDYQELKYDHDGKLRLHPAQTIAWESHEQRKRRLDTSYDDDD